MTHYAPVHNPLSQRGLSLVELMISLAIGVILLMGITALIVQQSSTRDELEKSSRQIENGRYAMQILHDDIEHAGYYSRYYNPPAPPAAAPNPCLTTPVSGAGSLEEAMSLPVQGYDVLPSSTAGSPITACLPNANYKPGTDILVIRRAASSITPMATAAANPGQVYLQAIAANHVLNTGANTAAFTLMITTQASTSVASLSRYLVNIYFISPCSTMSNGTTCSATDDNGSPIPTLKVLQLGANGGATAFTLVPLVEGIENMQLDYGIDSDGDGYPDNNYATAPATTADWSNVMSLRVNLLARNTDCTTGFTDTKSYSLGSLAGAIPAPAATCTNGDYKRHVFSELVRIVNPSGRRAQQ